MTYPSLLWSGTLAESREREPAVPESTIRDLLAEDDIRARSIPFFRIPCRPEEIPGRQRLILRMLKRHSQKAAGSLPRCERLRLRSSAA